MPLAVFLLDSRGDVREGVLDLVEGLDGFLQRLGDLGAVGVHVVDGFRDVLFDGDAGSDSDYDLPVPSDLDGDVRGGSGGDENLVSLLGVLERLEGGPGG